eukprot:m.849110 g.849110  ORF g.849110 m.849110 type:complete len:253 (+) comp23490_c2_seq30:1657-2415(+)
MIQWSNSTLVKTAWRALGHETSAVDSCCVCDTVAATGGSDGTIFVWNRATGELLRRTRAHVCEVTMLQHVQEDIFASASYECNIRVWYDATSVSLRHGEEVSCFTTNRTHRMVSGCNDKLVRVWDLQTHKLLHSCVGHQGEIYCVAVNENLIASGDSQATVRLWSWDGNALFVSDSVHIGCVRCMVMDHNKLVTGGDSRRIVVWDLKQYAHHKHHVLHRNPFLVSRVMMTTTCLVTSSPDMPGVLSIIQFAP